MPKVETIIMPTGGFWGGVGEPTICVAAPAVLNAYLRRDRQAHPLGAALPNSDIVFALSPEIRQLEILMPRIACNLSYRDFAATLFTLAFGACLMARGQIAPKAPEPATLKANADLAKTLPFADRADFDDAMRGFIGTMPDALVPGTARAPVWNMKPYDFLKQERAPPTASIRACGGRRSSTRSTACSR